MLFTLFGYPKTGKTTLFNLLTGAGIEVKAYEDGVREPHLRSVPVPDERFEAIAAIYPDKEKKPAVMDFIDLAGISFGQVKNSAYLNYLRRSDGLVHVARGFEEESVPFTKETIDPGRDIRSMEEELILADLVTVESRLEKLEKDLAKARCPEAEREKELLGRLRSQLEEGRPLREMDLGPQDDKLVRSFTFLSRKPILHLVNVGEEGIETLDEPGRFYSASGRGISVLAFCGRIEAEIMELPEIEKAAFLSEYGLRETSAAQFIPSSYDLLRVITFFTIGQKEVKAWTIPDGATALAAAGSIHTDMEAGFIRAEVISWKDLAAIGSLQEAKEKAAVRLEGRDYVVQDGDILYIRFSK